MAGDINFKLRYIVPLHPGIPRAHTVRKLGPEIPSELALMVVMDVSRQNDGEGRDKG